MLTANRAVLDAQFIFSGVNLGSMPQEAARELIAVPGRVQSRQAETLELFDSPGRPRGGSELAQFEGTKVGGGLAAARRRGQRGQRVGGAAWCRGHAAWALARLR